MDPVNNSQTVSPPPVVPPQPIVNQTQTPTSAPKKKGKMGMIISLLIILFLLCVSGAAGYTIFKNLQTNNQEVACTLEAMICPDGSSVGRAGPNCEFSPCPTVTPDATADWKTMEFDILEFKIPPAWYSFENGKNQILFYKNEIKLGWDSAPGFVLSKLSNTTLVETENKYKNGQYKDTEIINKSVNQFKAVQISGTIPPGYDVKDHYFKEISIDVNGEIYKLSVADYHVSKENIDLYFDQILSTFKFTN